MKFAKRNLLLILILNVICLSNSKASEDAPAADNCLDQVVLEVYAPGAKARAVEFFASANAEKESLNYDLTHAETELQKLSEAINYVSPNLSFNNHVTKSLDFFNQLSTWVELVKKKEMTRKTLVKNVYNFVRDHGVER